MDAQLITGWNAYPRCIHTRRGFVVQPTGKPLRATVAPTGEGGDSAPEDAYEDELQFAAARHRGFPFALIGPGIHARLQSGVYSTRGLAELISQIFEQNVHHSALSRWLRAQAAKPERQAVPKPRGRPRKAKAEATAAHEKAARAEEITPPSRGNPAPRAARPRQEPPAPSATLASAPIDAPEENPPRPPGPAPVEAASPPAAVVEAHAEPPTSVPPRGPRTGGSPGDGYHGGFPAADAGRAAPDLAPTGGGHLRVYEPPEREPADFEVDGTGQTPGAAPLGPEPPVPYPPPVDDPRFAPYYQARRAFPNVPEAYRLPEGTQVPPHELRYEPQWWYIEDHYYYEQYRQEKRWPRCHDELGPTRRLELEGAIRVAKARLGRGFRFRRPNAETPP